MRIKTITQYFLIFFVLLFSSSLFSKDTELSFWQFVVPEKEMRKILDEFEKRHPNIKVKMQQLNWRDGLDKIITSIATGITFDVCELGSTWVAYFASNGLLYGISDIISSHKDSFAYDALGNLEYKGNFYSTPWVAGTRVLYYNKKIFKQAGIDPDKPPLNWDELESYILKIASKCPGVYPFALPVGENYTPWQTFLPFLWSAGGSLFDPETNKVYINSKRNIETLRYYKKIGNYSLLTRQAHIDRNFALGKVAMIISGGWNIGLIPRLNPQLKFGISKIPGFEGNSVSFLGGEVLGIYQRSRHIAESKQLINFLISPEIQMRITKIVPSFIPTHKDCLNSPSFMSLAYRTKFIEQIKTSKSPPPSPKWSQIEEEISWAIEDTLFNNVKPEYIMEKLENKVEGIISLESKWGGKSQYSKFTSYIFLISILSMLVFLFLLINITRKKRVSEIPFRKSMPMFLFLSPWLIIFIIFYLFPFIYSFVLSLTDFSPLKGFSGFCGFANYAKILADPEFKKSFMHTLYFALGTCPVSLILALFSSLVIYKKIPFYKVFQAGIFAPIAISVIVASTVFSYFYSTEGIFNKLLALLNLPIPFPDNWLINPNLALLSVMIMNIWYSFGLYMIILTAGLHSIPREIIEVSIIDGAGSWHRLIHIILPQLKPFILIVVILNTVKAFQVFPEIFTMTQGGPHGATLTLVYYLYKTGFHEFNMGKASAIGYILFFIIGFLSILEALIFKKEEVYER